MVWRNFAPQNRKTEVPEPVEGPKRNMSTSLEDNYRHKGLRKQLVDQLRAKGITDEAVLSAINEVPRHIFLDSSFVELAYQDMAHGQKAVMIPTDNQYTTQVLYRLGFRWSSTSWDYVDQMLVTIGGFGYFD